MKVLVVLGLIGGLALATVLVLSNGLGAIWNAAAALGWSGFTLVVGIHLALIMLMGVGWWLLGRHREDARMARFVWGRLIRDSASEVLPFSQLGGFAIGARAATLAGVAGAFATASTIVDVSAELIGQLVYTLLGLALLAWLQPDNSLVLPVLAGLTAMTGLAAAFYVLQARGVGLVEDIGRRFAEHFVGRDIARSGVVQSEIKSIHAHPGTVGVSCLVHLSTWVLAGVETWLTLRMMNIAIRLDAALAIDSLLYGLRSVAFVVPNAVGVQEGGLIVLGGMFGVDASAALALSLVKRARDLVIGIPTLLVWQALEGHNGLKRKSRGEPVRHPV